MSNTVIVKQTPATLVVEDYYPSPGTKLFGSTIALVVGIGFILFFGLGVLTVLLLARTSSVLRGIGGELSGILFTGAMGVLALILGLRLLYQSQQRRYQEAQVWTFDKAAHSLTVSTQLRNRVNNMVSLQPVGSYPLPAPGAARAVSSYSGEHFYAQLIVDTTGGQLKGLEHRSLMSGNLQKEAQQINQFLS